MVWWLLCLVAICLVQVTWARIEDVNANVLREYPDSCFSLATGKAYTEGVSWDLPVCARSTCRRDRSLRNLVERIETCREIYADPPCYIGPIDAHVQFPLCCPKKICPDNPQYIKTRCPSPQSSGNQKPPYNPNV